MYYNVKIYLKKDFPFIRGTGEVNFKEYKKAANFIEKCGVNGFAVQGTGFGTIAIPAHNVDYIHATTQTGEMPTSTEIYLT